MRTSIKQAMLTATASCSFPGQENASGTTKIPTVLMYDQAGNLRAAGAEASLDGNMYKADVEGWVKAEW